MYHEQLTGASPTFGISTRSHRESGQDLGKGGPQPGAGLRGPPDEAGVALGTFRREAESDVIALYLGTQGTPSLGR